MRIGKPDYYDQFQCIAGACSDNCCIGWEIDIDEERKRRYAEVQGRLGERLRRCIDWEESHFILQGEEERCPFLNDGNLCDLILELGEEALCDICREHPRFYDWFDGYTEMGLGLCCEAAGRLILGRPEPMKLVAEGDVEVSCEEEFLFQARDTAFQILQNRDKPVWERLSEFLRLADELQERLDFGETAELEAGVAQAGEAGGDVVGAAEVSGKSDTDWRRKAKAYADMLVICRELEPIDGSWTETVNALEKMTACWEKMASLETSMLETERQREYEYEHLAVYFVYRYFMKCREDGDVRSKAYLAVFCVLFIRLLDMEVYGRNGQVTAEDRVQNAKCCSKEIEYSEENLEILADAFWEREEVSAERLQLLLR